MCLNYKICYQPGFQTPQWRCKKNRRMNGSWVWVHTLVCWSKLASYLARTSAAPTLSSWAVRCSGVSPLCNVKKKDKQINPLIHLTNYYWLTFMYEIWQKWAPHTTTEKENFEMWKSELLQKMTLVAALTWAPLSRSRLVISVWPSWAARWRGLTPCLVRMLVSAPYCSSAEAIFVWFFLAAMWRGV